MKLKFGFKAVELGGSPLFIDTISKLCAYDESNLNAQYFTIWQTLIGWNTSFGQSFSVHARISVNATLLVNATSVG